MITFHTDALDRISNLLRRRCVAPASPPMPPGHTGAALARAWSSWQRTINAADAAATDQLSALQGLLHTCEQADAALAHTLRGAL